jgi:transposase
MTAELNGLYAERGRPGIAPEQLLRALLPQVLYGFRSERRLTEEMRYNFALRWFVGLTMGEEPWDVIVFTKNRQRFLKGNVMESHEAQLINEERAPQELFGTMY